LKTSFDKTVRITVNIFLIVIGATLFGQFLTVSRIPVQLTSYIGSLDLIPYIIFALILLALIILGCFIDGLSIIVLTLPILYPIIKALGFDGLWFGVIMVFATNIGALTPPLGISVYVIKGVAKNISLQIIFKGVMPMIYTMFVCIIILLIFPQIVTPYQVLCKDIKKLF